MDPLERKKALREQFKKNKKLKKSQHKRVLSFSEMGLEVNADLLRAYRKERGGVDK